MLLNILNLAPMGILPAKRSSEALNALHGAQVEKQLERESSACVRFRFA